MTENRLVDVDSGRSITNTLESIDSTADELRQPEYSPRFRSGRSREEHGNRKWLGLVCAVGLLLAMVMVWRSAPDARNTNLAGNQGAAVIDIELLVFREGLECILVLAAITASMARSRQIHLRAVAAGSALALIATLLTWNTAVRVISDLGESVPALDLQAATGMLAVVVLLIVMNWFFHKVYWTGWISLHNRKKKELLEASADERASQIRILWGMALLGFTSVYREGFEVVLFLQSYQLRLGGVPVLRGASLGLFLSAVVAVMAFMAHRRLPYRRMLVVTGSLLGVVLLVMVGEQAQEMQQADWIPATTIPWLVSRLPAWMGQWFSVFPTVETLLAQGAAAAAVIGSYLIARERVVSGAKIGVSARVS
jgi:high-affinity iron transporter